MADPSRYTELAPGCVTVRFASPNSMVIAGKAKSKSKKKRRALCIGRAFKGGTGNNKKGKKARRIAPANVAPVPEACDSESESE